MGKKKSGRIDLGSGPGKGAAGAEGGANRGSLTHNPFAALRTSTGDSASKEIADSSNEMGRSQKDSESSAGPVGSAAALQGAQIVVRHERKGHGGKTVTIVDLSRASAPALAELDAVAKGLRKSLGVGARAQGDEITVQGDLVERVAKYFTDQFAAHVTLGTR